MTINPNESIEQIFSIPYDDDDDYEQSTLWFLWSGVGLVLQYDTKIYLGKGF